MGAFVFHADSNCDAEHIFQRYVLRRNFFYLIIFSSPSRHLILVSDPPSPQGEGFLAGDFAEYQSFSASVAASISACVASIFSITFTAFS